MDNDMLISIIAFAVLTLLWLGFAAALLFNRQFLGDAWRLFRSWPMAIQFLVAFLLLPVVLGLWIWQTSWPAWLRLLLVMAVVWATEYTFFPRWLGG